MHGIVLAAAMLVSSTGVSPVTEPSPATVASPALPFTLPALIVDDPEPRRGIIDERHRWIAPRQAARRTQQTKKFSPTDRVIAVAAGIAVGWVVGGAIGYYATADHDDPTDDTSGLRGVIIGAPIGGAVGGILGWKLTDR